VEYVRASATEWYINGPAGLEQGFTINKRPSVAGNEPLTVALAVSGGMATESGENGLALTDLKGTPFLDYSGLTAFDAAGRELRAWQELRDGRLLLKVDDSSALYPVVIDPWIKRAKLTASDGQSGDGLGFSIAVSGDTVVVGAPTSRTAAEGAVYVFVKPAAGWKNMKQVAKLTATDAAFEDELGFAVDIQGDTIVAGAPVVGFNSKPGAVYVFIKPAGGWKDMTQTAELLPSDTQSADQVGWSVSISGNTVASGAISAGSSGGGEVYVFVKPARGWKKHMTEIAQLSASDEQNSFALGSWVAIDHDTIVAGAPESGRNGGAQGAAYVYVKPAKGWKKNMTETAKLVASDGQSQDAFGSSVYVEGDTIVAGAPAAKLGSNQGQGAGYVFVKPASGWKGLITQTAKLTSSDGQAQDQLGESAAISGNTLALGASGAHVNGASNGAVYVYVKPKDGWKNMTQKFKLSARDGLNSNIKFGTSVSLSGTTLAIGAPVAGKTQQGAAYVFQEVK
jgi:hypothetical protein